MNAVLNWRYEDFRFFDIRRWRIAEDVCNEYIQGYDVTKGKDGGFYTIVNVGDRMVFEKNTTCFRSLRQRF